MLASMTVGRSEAKGHGYHAEASRVITKELSYLLSRLRTVDATTMRVCIYIYREREREKERLFTQKIQKKI